MFIHYVFKKCMHEVECRTENCAKVFYYYF